MSDPIFSPRRTLPIRTRGSSDGYRCITFQPRNVQQVLVPELKAGDIVILDNLGSHKGQE
ncbi:hypothetical protein GOB25_33350, partial [Sinorhizobium meliloti]|nr:hypothetical protein [Sinorhizobium meliloti]